MGIKTFVAIYLSIIIVVSAFLIVATPKLQTRNETASVNHFSVQWMGFQPTYSNETPDYYICINNLKDEVLTMNIAMQMQNFENTSYWFLIEQYSVPPAGWTITTYYIGLIGIDQTKTFIYSDIARTKPTAIAEGRMTESIELVVKAYRDASYTDFYSQDYFTVNFHLIDLNSEAWTQLAYDNFDDGTGQGWSIASGYDQGVKYYQQYRSWPCAFYFLGYYTSRGIWKTFDTTGPFTETYLIFCIYPLSTSDLLITLNGVVKFQTDLNFQANTWHQFCIPLPLSLSTTVRIFNTDNSVFDYLDDVYVIAK